VALIYKSIDDAIASLKRANRLRKFPSPAVLGAAASKMRRLYFTSEAGELLARNDDEGRAAEALFRQFASGDEIFVRPLDREWDRGQWSDLVMLARGKAAPPHPCELRPNEPSGVVRILGFFAAYNLFVCLIWSDDLHGGNYPPAIARCQAVWDELLPYNLPFRGRNFPNDYLSAAHFAS